MKRSVKTEYFKRVISALKSKLNVGNVFQAINVWAVPAVQYGAWVIQWTKEELRQMYMKTRKLLTIYGRLHPRSCVDRLYIPRSNGGRGLVSTKISTKIMKLRTRQAYTAKIIVICENNYSIAVNYFRKTFHRRCLTWFWIYLGFWICQRSECTMVVKVLLLTQTKQFILEGESPALNLYLPKQSPEVLYSKKRCS